MTDAPLDIPAAPWLGRRHLTMAIGSALLGLVVVASALAPVLSAYDPLKPSFSQRLAPPWGFGGTAAHVLGTDNLGRDILARLLHGGRASLALAVSAGASALATTTRPRRTLPIAIVRWRRPSHGAAGTSSGPSVTSTGCADR